MPEQHGGGDMFKAWCQMRNERDSDYLISTSYHSVR